MWDQMNKMTFKAFSNEPQRHIAKEPDGSVEPLRLRQYSVTFVNICLWKCSELNFLRRVAWLREGEDLGHPEGAWIRDAAPRRQLRWFGHVMWMPPGRLPFGQTLNMLERTHISYGLKTPGRAGKHSWREGPCWARSHCDPDGRKCFLLLLITVQVFFIWVLANTKSDLMCHCTFDYFIFPPNTIKLHRACQGCSTTTSNFQMFDSCIAKTFTTGFL